MFYPSPNAEEALKRAASEAADSNTPWALITLGIESTDAGLINIVASNTDLKAIIHYSPLLEKPDALVLVRANGHFIP